MKIGIDIGGGHIALGLVNDKNEIIAKKEHNWTESEKSDMPISVKTYTVNLIKNIIEENKISKIDMIGIGFPGSNIKDGIVYKYGTEINLPEILKNEFKVPVYLKNDVKCSSLCEKNIGNLKKYNNCLFMTLGTGIGGAYFYRNELVKPNNYPGFEIGHMTINMNGKVCKCGKRGCFEEYASMKAFRNQIEELFNIKGLTSFKMFEIIKSKEKEEEVTKIIDTYVEYLSIGISNLISIFEPDCICIGGSFSYYAPIFIDKLIEKIAQKFQGRKIPEILTAKYENDAGIIGASMLESN